MLAELGRNSDQKFNTNLPPFTFKNQVHNQRGVTAFSHLTLNCASDI